MNLYKLDENKENLVLYKLQPNVEKIQKYKQDRVKKCALRSHFYQLATTDKLVLQKVLHENVFSYQGLDDGIHTDSKYEFEQMIQTGDDCTILNRISSFPSQDSLFDLLNPEEYLNFYISGNYVCHNLVSFYFGDIENEISYCNNFLLLKSEKKNYIGRGKEVYYSVNMMLDLPEDLYALELFNNESYEALANRPFLLNSLPFHFYDEVDSIICDKAILEYDSMKEAREALPFTEKVLSKYHSYKRK